MVKEINKEVILDITEKLTPQHNIKLNETHITSISYYYTPNTNLYNSSISDINFTTNTLLDQLLQGYYQGALFLNHPNQIMDFMRELSNILVAENYNISNNPNSANSDQVPSVEIMINYSNKLLRQNHILNNQLSKQEEANSQTTAKLQEKHQKEIEYWQQIQSDSDHTMNLLKDENEKLQRNTIALENEIIRLKADLEQQLAQKDECIKDMDISILTFEQEKLQQINALEIQKQELETQLLSYKTQFKSYNDEMQTLHKKIDYLETENRDLSSHTLHERINQLETAIGQLPEQVAEARQRMQECTDILMKFRHCITQTQLVSEHSSLKGIELDVRAIGDYNDSDAYNT